MIDRSIGRKKNNEHSLAEGVAFLVISFNININRGTSSDIDIQIKTNQEEEEAKNSSNIFFAIMRFDFGSAFYTFLFT